MDGAKHQGVIATISPDIAARRLASTLVDRWNLEPPIDVLGLLSARAEVKRFNWKWNEVDAILLQEAGLDPFVGYRKVAGQPLRERFTLAHELGHLLIPWHVANLACTVGEGVIDPVASTEEAQADIFASALLAPDRWLDALIQDHRNDMESILEKAQQAELSTMATLLALRRVLYPGWIFQINNQQQAITSRGSGSLEPHNSSPSMRRHLNTVAHDSGQSNVAGNTVRWWRLSAENPLPTEDSDPRTSTQLIRDALRASGVLEEHLASEVQRVNGKVGGSTNDLAGKPAADIYASLWHRFEVDDSRGPLLETADFPTWLARKARLRSASR